jgi:hypothetical protein
MREDRSFNGLGARRPPVRTLQPEQISNEATQARAY